jgi:PAS domain S-box-containing protein
MGSTKTPEASASGVSSPATGFHLLTPGVVTGFLGVAVILIATLFVGLANLRDVYETNEAVAHTFAVKTSLEELLSTLVDAETGERGFVITGDTSYLEPYNRARGALSTEFGRLRALTADNREQQVDLDRLSMATELKLRELADAVQRRQKSGFEAAQRAVADNVGKGIMDDMRVIVARMEAREDALLAERTAQAARSYESARLTRIVTTVVALLALIALFVATRRFGAARWRAAETAERLKVTLASIGDAVMVTDLHGRVVRLNPVAEALTGWIEAEAVGRPLEEVLPIVNEESHQAAENPVNRVLREGLITGLANHTLLVSKDGREIPIDDSAAPIRNEDGQMTGVVMVFRDITDRRRVEREHATLLERERIARADTERARREIETAAEQLRVALDAGRMGTWEYTMATGVVKWSPGLEAIHGFPPGSFPGTFDAFRNEIHPDDRDRVLEAIWVAVDARCDHHVEYRIVRADGVVRWVEGRGRLFCDESGQPERMAGVCLDVTERKQSEERFRLAVEAAPAAMIMVDQRGAIVLTNALTEELLGYSRDELVGQPVDQFVPPRYRDQHADHRRAFFADSRRRPMGAGRDLFAVRKDGTEVPVEIGLSPIQTPDGVFVLAAVTDITARKQVEEERSRVLVREQTARAELERASRLKDEFLAVLSHELRTPLNAVLGYSHLLTSGALPPDRARHALEAIERNAHAQARLVESLLDLSRVMAGKLELDLRPLDLSGIIDAALDVVRPDAEARGVTLEAIAPRAALTLVADGPRLQQVFWNLLSNAVKFTPRGGRITIRWQRRDEQARVEVSDDGQGISADFLPHVFDRFSQADTKGRRSPAGLGLGLALVREMVHAHGGTVVAQSAGEGGGSTFVVTLPASEGMAVQPKNPATAQPAAEVALPPLDVLVVDDEADVRNLMGFLLESRGAVPRTASSAPEALEALRQRRPDVLLADVRMPYEDGYSLIRRVRDWEREQQRPHLPAIAVTAYARPSDREKAIAAGFDWHVAKPVAPEELVAAISKVMKADSV